MHWHAADVSMNTCKQSSNRSKHIRASTLKLAQNGANSSLHEPAVKKSFHVHSQACSGLCTDIDEELSHQGGGVGVTKETTNLLLLHF